jgi:hypothetical protein
MSASARISLFVLYIESSNNPRIDRRYDSIQNIVFSLIKRTPGSKEQMLDVTSSCGPNKTT